MEKIILEKIITKEVLKLLKENNVIGWNTIDYKLKEYDLREEELEVVYEIIANSKAYNYITLQNGEGFIFGKTEKEIKEFLSSVNIDKNDDVWNEYISCDGSSYRLNYFID